MNWLVSMVMTSLLGAVIVTKIFDVLTGGIIGPVATSAKNSLFVSAWTAITTGLGVRGLKKAARNLRPGRKEVEPHINNPLKGKRIK